MHESSFKRGVKHVRQVKTPRFDVVGVTDALSLVVEDGPCAQSTAWRFRSDGPIGSNFSSLSIVKLAMRRKD